MEKRRGTEVKKRPETHVRSSITASAGHRAAHSDVGGNMQLDGFPGCLLYFYTQQHKPSSAPDHRCLLTLSALPTSATSREGPTLARSYMVIYTRTPQHGWFPLDADSLVPIPVRSHPSCWAKTAGLPLPRVLNPRTLRRLALYWRVATNLRPR